VNYLLNNNDLYKTIENAGLRQDSELVLDFFLFIFEMSVMVLNLLFVWWFSPALD